MSSVRRFFPGGKTMVKTGKNRPVKNRFWTGFLDDKKRKKTGKIPFSRPKRKHCLCHAFKHFF